MMAWVTEMGEKFREYDTKRQKQLQAAREAQERRAAAKLEEEAAAAAKVEEMRRHAAELDAKRAQHLEVWKAKEAMGGAFDEDGEGVQGHKGRKKRKSGEAVAMNVDDIFGVSDDEEDGMDQPVIGGDGDGDAGSIDESLPPSKRSKRSDANDAERDDDDELLFEDSEGDDGAVDAVAGGKRVIDDDDDDVHNADATGQVEGATAAAIKDAFGEDSDDDN